MDHMTRIRVKIGEIEAEVSGSEEFVREHGTELLHEFSKRAPDAVVPSVASKEEVVDNLTRQLKHPSEHSNLFEIDGTSVRVLSHIPGSLEAEKQVNAALLYLLGLSSQGALDGRYSGIRDLCTDHGISLNHFAGNIRDEKNAFIVTGTGTGKDPTIRLTTPGKTRARELSQQIEAAG